MACVAEQGAYCLVITVLMFLKTVNGDAQTTVSCESNTNIGQPQTLTCNVNGPVTNDIYWFRDDETNPVDVINCFKTTGGDVGTCISTNSSLYSVSSQPQQPKQQVFTIIKVSAEDFQVSWLCVDRTSFPDRASIQVESKCSLKQETTTSMPKTTEGSDSACSNCSCSLIGGLAFICDFVFGLAASTLITFVIEKGLSTPLKIGVFVVPAVASGILGGGSYGACLVLVSIGGIVGINIACMLVVVAGTYAVVKFCCK